MYVGGNKDGADGGKLMGLCPKWWRHSFPWTLDVKLTICTFSEIHIYEPVPQFNQQLQQSWEGLVATHGWAAFVHKFGLGAENR